MALRVNVMVMETILGDSRHAILNDFSMEAELKWKNQGANLLNWKSNVANASFDGLDKG